MLRAKSLNIRCTQFYQDYDDPNHLASAGGLAEHGGPMLGLVVAFAFAWLSVGQVSAETGAVSRKFKFTAGDIMVEAPWLLATQPDAKIVGGYMKITNVGTHPDRLVGGTLDRARRFEIREISVVDGLANVRTFANGIEIEPGQTLELKPGGYQIAGLDIKRGYAKGETINGSLTFARAGTLNIEYAVPRAAPSPHAPAIGSQGGSFALIDQWGRSFSSAMLAGQPYVIFFGFTHCPDVCPTTLLVMTNSLAALGRDADKLRVVFVTVDPDRDTHKHLAEYLSSFDPRIIGLTGTQAQIAATAAAWNAFYERLSDGKGDYSIIHSAHVYLMDRNNRLVGALGFQEPEGEQLAKLRRLIIAAGVDQLR